MKTARAAEVINTRCHWQYACLYHKMTLQLRWLRLPVYSVTHWNQCQTRQCLDNISDLDKHASLIRNVLWPSITVEKKIVRCQRYASYQKKVTVIVSTSCQQMPLIMYLLIGRSATPLIYDILCLSCLVMLITPWLKIFTKIKLNH